MIFLNKKVHENEKQFWYVMRKSQLLAIPYIITKSSKIMRDFQDTSKAEPCQLNT